MGSSLIPKFIPNNRVQYQGSPRSPVHVSGQNGLLGSYFEKKTKKKQWIKKENKKKKKERKKKTCRNHSVMYTVMVSFQERVPITTIIVERRFFRGCVEVFRVKFSLQFTYLYSPLPCMSSFCPSKIKQQYTCQVLFKSRRNMMIFLAASRKAGESSRELGEEKITL